MKIRIIILGLVFVAGVPFSASAGKWTDFAIVSTKDDVVVSYRQRHQEDGWFVEWKVDNTSADWVEPLTNSRTYVCADGKRQAFEKKAMGFYPPGDGRKGGIRDRAICPGSEIQSVEVDIELRPVSEVIRKMWK